MNDALTTSVSDSNFEHEVLQSPLPTLVELWAGWSLLCQYTSGLILQVAQKHHPAMKCVRVDVDHSPLTSSLLGMTSLPCYLIFREGQIVKKLTGPASLADIDELIEDEAWRSEADSTSADVSSEGK